MNNNPDQIQVITSNRFRLPPKKYLILIIILALVILAFFLYPKITAKKPPAADVTQTKQTTVSATATPSAALNQVVEGKLKDLTKDSITLESTKSGQLSFNLIAATIYYQCTDFNNINKCKISKDNLKTGSLIKVFAKSKEVLYVLYK